MSHLKERSEKECLNCNAIIYGRFCQVCGQENVEPKETFLYLFKHFIEDITHFDGKFFDTLKYLLLRPGFLSYEYMRGRRHSYLNPIRLYVFTSAIFFLVYFSLHNSPKDATHNAGGLEEKSDTSTITAGTKIEKVHQDSIKRTYAYKPQTATIKVSQKDSFAIIIMQLENAINNPKNALQKERLNKELKVAKTVEKAIKSFSKYGDDVDSDSIANHVATNKVVQTKKQKSTKFLDKIFGNKEQVSHSIPKVMFITLPLMALILQGFYRKLKQFYYVNHIIFITHLYVAVFLILLLGIVIDYMDEKTHWTIFAFLSSFVGMAAFFYTYKAMRNFYHQSRFKTFSKCVVLYIFFTTILAISLSIFNYTTSLNAH